MANNEQPVREGDHYSPKCGLCGKAAVGYALYGDVRLCHEEIGDTCYLKWCRGERPLAPQPDFKDAEADLDFNGCPECGDQNPRWVIEGACDHCHAYENLVEAEAEATMFKDLARRLLEFVRFDSEFCCCCGGRTWHPFFGLHEDNCCIAEAQFLFAEPTDNHEAE